MKSMNCVKIVMVDGKLEGEGNYTYVVHVQ